MNVRVIALLLLPVMASAQGFAGLGSESEGFATPGRPATFDFPADHGSHPDYRIEWWYLTANLQGEDGTAYGLQWTLFRSALAPEAGHGWASPQLWMGTRGGDNTGRALFHGTSGPWWRRAGRCHR